MDLEARARGSLSRSTLLLRESILEGGGRARGEEERTVGRRVAAGQS